MCYNKIMKKKKRQKNEKQKRAKEVTKNISFFILDILVNIPGGLAHAFLDSKGLYQRIEVEGFFVDRFSDRIKYLKKYGYIEIDKNNNSISITRKGKIKHLENSSNKTMDGKWRLLSFDIPENMSLKRDRFRRSIKRIGYKQVQKSLWACPFIMADEVDLIIDEHKIRNYVAYFIIEKTDIEDHLKKLFKHTKIK